MSCGCCCEYVDIFRCEHLTEDPLQTAAFWNTTAEVLQPVLCDNQPFPYSITASDESPWVLSGTTGACINGSFVVGLDATALCIEPVFVRFGGPDRTDSMTVSLYGDAAVAAIESDWVPADQRMQWFLPAFSGVSTYTADLREYPSRLKLNDKTRVLNHVPATALVQSCLESAEPGSSVVVTALAENIFGDFRSGTPPYAAGTKMFTGYVSAPPTQLSIDSNASHIEVYRNGVFVGSFVGSHGDYSIECDDVEGDGTYASPLSSEQPPAEAVFTPSQSGVLRMRVVFNVKPPFFPGPSVQVWRVEPNVQLAYEFASYDPIADAVRYPDGRGVPRHISLDVTGGDQYRLVTAGDVAIESMYLQPPPQSIGTIQLSDEQSALFSQQGAYVLHCKHDEQCEYAKDSTVNRLFDGQLLDENVPSGGRAQTVLQPLRAFTSFVLLTEPPAIAGGHANDVYDSTVAAAQWRPGSRVVFLDAPEVVSINSGNFLVMDSAGNTPFSSLPENRLKAMPDPGAGSRGAVARFEILGDEFPDVPLRRAAVRRIGLVFDRPVYGVDASMISVAGNLPPNGSAATLVVVGFSRVRDSLTRYEIEIPTQGFNTQWTISFQPTEAVKCYLNGTTTRHFDAFDKFPASGESGIVYHDRSTKADFVWQGGEYIAPPNEVFAESGTTRLAARFMWAIQKDRSVGRFLVNTSRSSLSETQLFVAASLTDSIDSPTFPGGSTFSSSKSESSDGPSGCRFPRRLGQFHRGLPVAGLDSFAPRMPNHPDTGGGPADAGYFGQQTTFYPSTPKLLSKCAAAAVPQRHSSLLFGDREITGLTFTLTRFIGEWSVDLPSSQSSSSGYRAGPGALLAFSIGNPVISIPGLGNVRYGSPFSTWTYSFAEALQGHSFPCVSTIGANPIPQNVWRCTTSPQKTVNGFFFAAANNSDWPRPPGPFPLTATLHSLIATARVERAKITYPALGTTTVTQALITLVLTGCDISMTNTAANQPFSPSSPGPWAWNSHTVSMPLTKEQELALVAGEPVFYDAWPHEWKIEAVLAPPAAPTGPAVP